MTVKQMIAILSTMDQDYPVVINMGKNELANGKEAQWVQRKRAVKGGEYFRDDFYWPYGVAQYGKDFSEGEHMNWNLEDGEQRASVVNITS